MKPLTGTFLDFRHPNPREGDYWNERVARLTPQGWREKVLEMHDMGMTTLIALSVALGGKAFYPSRVITDRWEAATHDPVKELLSAAEACGAEVFLGLGYFSERTGDYVGDDRSKRLQADVAAEIAERYGQYRSFHGWYLPVEAGISQYFNPGYLEYAQRAAAICRALTPGKPILIAPYGTKTIIPDSRYVDQLRILDVDIVAYQDGVGVEACTPEELGPIFQGLKRAHQEAGRSSIWVDLEIFAFEGEGERYRPLVPAPFERVKRQIENLSPHVERVICYQYWGLMNSPNATVHLGHPSSTRLYEDYREWRRCVI